MRGEGDGDGGGPGEGEGGSTFFAGGTDAWGAGPAEAGGEDPLCIPEAARYERGLELGRGGMGRVVAARDRRLGRQVALKEVRPGVGVGDATAQLAAEAQLAAGLDHPGILTIHDAGRDARGQPFYVMRLVRGETLTQAAQRLQGPSERQRLVPALLAACHAVAHAHERGILHRDLKPDNILVGPHGESQVADWGLACAAAEARGGAVGTAAFMAPEVAAGGPASAPSDVYSLGATLVALLLGRDSDLRAGAAALPPELGAIAERCLAEAPARRYRDAGALADDLSAWLEGRRVAAHRYSLMELLGRLVRAFRLPLLVGAVALLLIAAVAVQGYRRTLSERDRAVAAERRAEQSLSAAYVQAAEAAAAVAARPEAETLAAAALSLAESPVARGLLARDEGGPRVRLLSDATLPACHRLRLSPEGGALLCLQDDGVALLGPDGAPRWRRPGHFYDGAISEAAGQVVLSDRDYRGTVLSLGSGETLRAGFALVGLSPLSQRGAPYAASFNSGHLQLLDLKAGRDRVVPARCGAVDVVVAAAFGREPGTLLGACRFGAVLGAPPGGPAAEVVAASVPRAGAGTINVSAIAVTDSGAVLLGALDGRLFVDGRPLAGWAGVGRAAPALLTLWGGPGGAVAALGEGLGPTLWLELPGPGGGAAPAAARLPAQDRQALAFPDARSVVVAGARLRRYALEPAPRAARFESSAGLSEAALSPDRALLAGAAGDGALSLWRTDTGALVRRLPLSAGVLKGVAFSPDGAELAVGMAAAPGFRRLALPSLSELPSPRPVKIKQLGYLADGTLWRCTYEDGIDLLPRGAAEVRPLPCSPGVCSQGRVGESPSRRGILHLRHDGDLLLLRQEAPLSPELIAREPWATAVALSADLRRFAVADEAHVRLYDVASRRLLREIADPGRSVLHLAFSPDDALIFVAERDRAARIFRVEDGAELAVLRGHGQRVAQVISDAASGHLLTVSWDGTVLRHDLAPILGAPTALQAGAAARFGLPIESALRLPSP